VVWCAGKRPQPVADVASPVTIITAEEIHAHGFQTLGEALRWVRGMYVTSDRVYSYLGVRGMQRPGDFNNKVLLAIDGHTMNGNVYGDAYFDASLGIDLDLVERIEILHGPAAELYGDNAALAVVNVVMRRPVNGPAAQVQGRAGSADRRQALVSLATARPGLPHVLAIVSWLDARGLDLYYPEFDPPATNDGRAIDADGEHSRAFFGSADWGGLRLVAKFGERTKRIPTGSFGTLFGDNRYRAYDGHDFVELSGQGAVSSTLQLFGRGYWDLAHYHATYVFDYGSGAVLNQDVGRGEIVGSEVRGVWTPVHGGHVVTAGLEGKAKISAHLSNADVDPYASYLDVTDERTLVAAYAHDELRLAPELHLSAGVRVDHSNRFDDQWSPGVGLAWRDPHGTEWKLRAARGFRVPTPYETSYEASTVRTGDPLHPEAVRTLEATVARRMGPADVLVTGYLSDLDDVIDLTDVDTLGTQQYMNVSRVTSRGVETQADFRLASGTYLNATLAVQSSVRAGTDDALTNSPTWDAGVRFRREPTRGPWSVGTGVRLLSVRRMRTGRETAPAVVTDARVARRMGERFELGVEVKNLFDSRYADPASGELLQEQILQDPRSVFVTFALWSGVAP